MQNIYYTTIPDIIFEMGLNPHELATYCYLKQIVEENGGGYCESLETLCKRIRISSTKLLEIKKSLAQKGLIKVEKRFDENGGNMPDLITIVIS